MQDWTEGQSHIAGRTAMPPCVVSGQVASLFILKPKALHSPDVSWCGSGCDGTGFADLPGSPSADQPDVAGKENIAAANNTAKKPWLAFMAFSFEAILQRPRRIMMGLAPD